MGCLCPSLDCEFCPALGLGFNCCLQLPPECSVLKVLRGWCWGLAARGRIRLGAQYPGFCLLSWFSLQSAVSTQQCMVTGFSNQILTNFSRQSWLPAGPLWPVSQPHGTFPAVAEKNPLVGTLADPAEGNWGPKSFLPPHLAWPPGQL